LTHLMENNTMSEKVARQTGFSELTIDDWLSKFGRIYGKRHDKHTTEYMISRLVEEVAELVNPMESLDNSQIAPNLADVFSWICSIAFKLNIDLSGLAWEKYGHNAPRPLGSKGGGLLQDFSQPRTLSEWQSFISRVYQKENLRLTPMNALVAMMKDVGDLAMLHRKRVSRDQITSKLAAILAWTLTLSQLLKLDLATVVFAKYDDHCPVCGREICDTDICHPLSTMYVSFGTKTPDEEKYVILDSAAKLGFETLVNTASALQNTSDLSTSLDLINRSDAACILISGVEGIPSGADYRQVFETLACYSVLSKGNVWIFAKNGSKGFVGYIRGAFDSEKLSVTEYNDSNHLRSLFESNLQDLLAKKRGTE
jgi:NTP pyrophosphatase (non-canonical NTP hydrolase)